MWTWGSAWKLDRQCKFESVDHSQCPDRTACFADPVGVVPEHAQTVITERCPNETVGDTEDYCRKHLKQMRSGSHEIWRNAK